jgi:manganese oxidase
MVGPRAHAGSGMAAGRGLPEGMGLVRSDHALSPDLGPSLGRGIGITTTEKSVSHAVGQTPHEHGAETPPAARVPGFPQDMWMTMDDAVASPETEGMAPGWTGAMMGMMTTVRVLEPDRYAAIMAGVRRGKGTVPAEPPPHSHHEGD